MRPTSRRFPQDDARGLDLLPGEGGRARSSHRLRNGGEHSHRGDGRTRHCYGSGSSLESRSWSNVVGVLNPAWY